MNNIPDKKYYSYQVTQRFLQAMDHLLEREKITAAAFGEIVRIPSSNLARLRTSTGENTVTTEAIARICDHWKVSPYWLITGDGEIFTDASLFAAYESIETRVMEVEKAVKSIGKSLEILHKTSPKFEQNRATTKKPRTKKRQ